MRRTADVEVGPDIDLDRAVERVIESTGPLRDSVGALVGRAKRLAMQARPTRPGRPCGSAIEHAALDQANQEIGIHCGVGQRLQVLATIQCHHRTWRISALDDAYLGDLCQGDLGHPGLAFATSRAAR
jgi:hypothetical protein